MSSGTTQNVFSNFRKGISNIASFIKSLLMKDSWVENSFQIVLNNIWLFIKALAVNIVVFLISIGAFTASTQALDVINGIAQDGRWQPIILWFGIFLLSLSIWYTSILALAFYDLRNLKPVFKPQKDNNDHHENWIKVLPYVLGISVYAVICFAFNGSEIVSNPYGWIFLLTGFLLGGTGFFFREKWMKSNSFESLVHKGPLAWEAQSVPDKKLIEIIFWGVLIIIIAALTVSSFATKPTWIFDKLNSAFIIAAYLTGVVLLYNIIWQENILWQRLKIVWKVIRKLFDGTNKETDTEYSHLKKAQIDFKRFSISFLVIIWILIVSLFNNNHSLRKQKEGEIIRKDLSTDFKDWLSIRLTNAYDAEGKFPIVFVAAEGGGIRSMKWTALLLDKFYQDIPNFNQHIYAISGVSGGSVGAVFQQSTLGEKANPQTDLLRASIDNDFLSPVTFGLLFPDMIQSVIPWPIHSWDRSRFLEDAFYHSVNQKMQSDVLNETLNTRWYAENKPKPAHIFLNCTALETGQKVLISDLIIPEAYFGNTIDLQKEIHNFHDDQLGIPLKTAASLSARFPLVTSAGKVRLDSQRTIQVVDGGYHDNTGLETISQILHMILLETDSADLSRMSFNVIMLKNSLDKNLDTVASADFIVDVSAPLNTIVSNWGNSTVTTLHNMGNNFKAYEKMGLDINYYPFHLDRKVFRNNANERVDEKSTEEKREIILPLGWYLSSQSKEEIDRQLNAINDSTEIKGDSMAIQNFSTFQKLKSQIK